MITGYNTDVKHGTHVFHIQTEDKGDTNPCIESHVYVGGEILGTTRTSYAAAVKDGRDDQAVQELMEQQHRKLIAAIQRGRFDGPNGSLRVPEEMSRGGSEAGPAPTRTPSPEAPPAVAGDRTLDQVILDYLASEMGHEQVDVALSPNPQLVAGRSADFKLKAESSVSRQPVTGAAVQVRLLSTVSKPAVVFQGKTGSDGSCAVHFMVPAFSEGNAAAVIRVFSPSGSTEVKLAVKNKA